MVVSCGGSDNNNNNSSNTNNNNNSATAPVIFSVGPADSSVNVSPTSSVSVTFSEAMDTAATENAFSLSTGGVPISGTFSWSGYTMKFTPNSNLTTSKEYLLSISASAVNSSGTGLASIYNSSFTTGAIAIAPSSITNIIDEVATSDLSGWTEEFAPGECSKWGIQITTSGGWCYYSRSDIDTSNGKAFQIEAILSADPLPGDGESGARMWAIFYKTGTSGPAYYIELRLQMDGGVLNLHLVDFHGGGPDLTLNKEWTSHLRVRIKRQLVNGVDYIFLQAEDPNSWDDPTDPNNLNNANSIGAPLNLYQAAIGYHVEFGFGNFIVGDYTSEWKSVHITVGEDANTVLPYWPPAPPKPILIFDDKGVGNLQGINFSSYGLGTGYLTNDTITSYINADGVTTAGETRTAPNDEFWNFVGLGANQNVTGYVTVTDVSGRSRTSSNGTVSIPSR